MKSDQGTLALAGIFDWWLDPDNLEGPDKAAQAPLNELVEVSGPTAAEVDFWPDTVDAGNV